MSSLTTNILDRAGQALGEYLPRFGGALAILVVGLLLVRLLGRLLARLLIAAGVDRLSDRIGIDDLLARAGLERSLSRLIGMAVRLALAVAVLFAAVSQLGLAALTQSLNEGVLFLPRLLAALALVLAGVVLARLARDRVERAAYQMALRGPLGPLVQGAVIAVFAVLALDQVGVPTAILTVLAAIVAAGAVLTFTLAFGLGSREFAREISAGRYVSAAFAVGQEVTVGEDRAEIVAIDPTSTLLETDDGRALRLPNHVFLEGRVTIHPRR